MDDGCEDEDMPTDFFAIDFDKREKRIRSMIATVPIPGTYFPSDCGFPVNKTSFDVADLRYLELIRRGEEADRILTLSRAEGTAVRRSEDERCAE